MPVANKFQSHFAPAVEHFDGCKVNQYRGIKYGAISKRFSEPTAISYEGTIEENDCTKFGPLCPQTDVDFYHLLRIPESITLQERSTRYDEFECLNLDITTPVDFSSKLPVMIWIHGGSQVMTFMPPSSKCADVVPFVVNSIKQEQPMIVVFVNYRLNIFGFGDGNSSKNLALKDQRLAIEWVVKHIGGFGGDPENITLAGESAGAVYVHAHLVTKAPVQRAILQSGSLYLSPPQDGKALCNNLEAIVKKDGFDLRNAPMESMVRALEAANVVSMFLQPTPDLEDWERHLPQLESLLVGDVEYESAIWRNGIETLNAAEIVSCFDEAGNNASELKSLYNIVQDRPTSCKLGALDLIHDTRFTFPVMTLKNANRRAGVKVYDYVFDQVNPWQASSRSHHGVDMVLLFGGLDLGHNMSALKVQQDMRSKWASFCNGSAPWSGKRTYAFGPHGRCGEIDQDEFEGRRRVHCCEMLKKLGFVQYNAVFKKLAAGRISLLN